MSHKAGIRLKDNSFEKTVPSIPEKPLWIGDYENHQEVLNQFVTIQISKIWLDNEFFFNFSFVRSKEFKTLLRRGQILLTRVDGVK